MFLKIFVKTNCLFSFESTPLYSKNSSSRTDFNRKYLKINWRNWRSSKIITSRNTTLTIEHPILLCCACGETYTSTDVSLCRLSGYWKRSSILTLWIFFCGFYYHRKLFITQSPSFGNFVTNNGGINERIHGVFRGPLTRAQSLLSQNERVQMTHLI